MKSTNHRILAANLFIVALTAHVEASEFVKGYTRYDASQLLENNNPGAGGEILFIDQAETGGNDLTANAGNPDWGFSVVGGSDWTTGDTVSFTGLAVPIWANDPDADSTDNTQNASWRLRFYSTGADGEWDGQNNLSTTDDSLIGEATVEFTSAGAGVDVYYATFDTPIQWTADSPKIWFHIQALGNKAMRLKTGPTGAAAIREVRTSGAAVGSNINFAMSLAGRVTPSLPKGDALEWHPNGPGDNASLYSEANWIDPLKGNTPPATTVDPNTPLNRSLVIRAGAPGGGSGAGGNLLLGSGDLTVSRATLRMSKGSGSGINMGTYYRNLNIEDGKVLTQFISNGRVNMDGHSELTLYGSNPLTNTTVNLRSSDCFVYFLGRLPSDVDGDYLANFTVNGAPAVLNDNVLITQYYLGAVIRPTLPGGIAMKGFDLPNLEGTAWDFTTGFKGKVGVGLSSIDAGTYTISGWGSDIWGTGDEFHFTCREMTGDSEIIAKVDSVENTNIWAKGGAMFRSDLTDGSPNAFIFQRPDNQITFQTRATSGGITSSTGPVGGTAAVKWVRLLRSGNAFSGYYSTASASGPWTQVGATSTIAMPNTILAGLAVTSHNGVERGTSVFSEVSTVPATTGTLGIFNITKDIEGAWNQEDQISSFLLKKGYMVTVATEGGGQGTSQVYVASEADLRVELPPSLDNQISFMRVLPWRWVSKKGWAGAANVFPDVIKAHWKYEWEPTGNSTMNWEFVPMIRGRTQDKDFRWEEVRVRGGQTHFLGFNEPNVPTQGDLSVDEAIALWPKAQQLGLRLGSPARTDNASGDNWLMDFMTKADTRGYRVDYICLHNYNRTNAASLKAWLDAEHAKYNRPIWLTEFQRDVDSGNPTAADHEAYLAEVLPMLESLDYLERYSYYNFNTANPSNSFASLFNGDDTVNAKGQLYLDIDSKPAYTNTGQPTWATASLDQPTGGILQLGYGDVITASTSIASASIIKVEFFVNGISAGTDNLLPYQLSVDSLSMGLQTIYSVVTTTFGEEIISGATQAFVTKFGLLAPISRPTGKLTWSAVPGETYEFQSTTDLGNPVWNTIETRIATGFEESASDPAWGTGSKRFYRIKW